MLPATAREGARMGVVSPTDARLLTSADPLRSTVIKKKKKNIEIYEVYTIYTHYTI